MTQELESGFPQDILGESKSLRFEPTDWTDDFRKPVWFAVIETKEWDPDEEETHDAEFGSVRFYRDFCEEWEDLSSCSGNFFAGTIVRKGDGYELEIDQWWNSESTCKMQVDLFDAKVAVKAFYNAWKVFREAPDPFEGDPN